MPALTVILVDDDPLMLRMLAPRLANLDAGAPVGRVVTAGTPEAALDEMERAGPGPLAVLSDFNLKATMNGLQLLAAVRKRRPDAARVLFSGYSLEQIGDVASGGDAHGFVEKPLRLDEMIPPLAELVRKGLASP